MGSIFIITDILTSQQKRLHQNGALRRSHLRRGLAPSQPLNFDGQTSLVNRGGEPE